MKKRPRVIDAEFKVVEPPPALENPQWREPWSDGVPDPWWYRWLAKVPLVVWLTLAMGLSILARSPPT